VDERSLTLDHSTHWAAVAEPGPPVPGVLLVFSAGEPLHGPLPVPPGGLVLGRGTLAGVTISDPRMSREHARVERVGDGWTVIDLGSRNGTAVDGVPITGRIEGAALRFVRTGDTLFLLCADLRPFQRRRVEVDGDVIVGPTLARTIDEIRRAAGGGTLHVTGPSGAGKELAARAFHRLGPAPAGPFVAVNCAAIPGGVAERLLFGARKGAFSGAHADATGYMQEASGGTLFLDEVGELDLDVQAKLLRVVETREVLPLGASRPVKVDVRLCSATHRDLRQLVAARRFREDLFFRIARPTVAIPRLADRAEEIPFLIDREARASGRGAPVPHASLVEAALLRPWPGNVRELLVECRGAIAAARAAGDSAVRRTHLAEGAGEPLPPVAGQGQDAGDRDERGDEDHAFVMPERGAIEAALAQHGGRVATAARALGIHRNQLRRWLTRNKIDPTRSGGPGGD
jgi:DNA-binding NtrC family response regulator